MKRRFVQVNSDQSLSLAEDILPPLEKDEVLIKVCAAGINRGDLLQRKGLYPPPKSASPIMGLEVSGEIVEIGSAVTAWKTGDKICALTHGAGYCDYTIVPASQCLPLPTGMELLIAAALPEAVFTVWHNLFQRCRLKAGESVLVHGGSSGIGTTAIQMARAFGAQVYACAGSDKKCRACEKIGADKAINYRNEDFEMELRALRPDGIDVILDMAGGDFIQKNIHLAATEGRIATIALVRGSKAEVNFSPLLMKRLTLTASTLRAQSFEVKATMAEEIRAQVWPKIECGKIQPVVDSIFSFDKVDQAHQRMVQGEHIGKILLSIGS